MNQSGHGPYFRLVFRERGRQRSVYLGADRRLADEVRRELGMLPAEVRAQRQLRRQRTILRRELRRSRRDLDRELRKEGHYRKGREIRGWRSERSIE